MNQIQTERQRVTNQIRDFEAQRDKLNAAIEAALNYAETLDVLVEGGVLTTADHTSAITLPPSSEEKVTVAPPSSLKEPEVIAPSASTKEVVAVAPPSVEEMAKPAVKDTLATEEPAAAKTWKRGRRGDRPTNAEAFRIVMGTNAMCAHDLIPLLTERGWLPVSGDIENYLDHQLQTNKKVFSRAMDVGSKYYRAIDPVIEAKPAKAAKGNKVGKGAPDVKTEEVLHDLGIGKPGNPFGSVI